MILLAAFTSLMVGPLLDQLIVMAQAADTSGRACLPTLGAIHLLLGVPSPHWVIEQNPLQLEADAEEI